jgi:murein DD-endopeptidase MepM/ murein hydrolase activator NlpD
MRGAVPVALLASFAAGALIDGWFRTHGPPKPAVPLAPEVRLKPDTAGTQTKSQAAGTQPAMSAPPVGAPSSAISAAPSSLLASTSGTTGELSHSRLRMPIDGQTIEALKGGFAERRNGTRPHEAVDMLAPRHTPIHAVEDGTIAKLFTSKAGGLTIYQFDPSGHLCYYYAHLDAYADGLKDGQAVSKGEILGYVGTTGNAPANTPHLHFAVFELDADKRWWKGKAVDPYRVFRDRG